VRVLRPEGGPMTLTVPASTPLRDVRRAAAAGYAQPGETGWHLLPAAGLVPGPEAQEEILEEPVGWHVAPGAGTPALALRLVLAASRGDQARGSLRRRPLPPPPQLQESDSDDEDAAGDALFDAAAVGGDVFTYEQLLRLQERIGRVERVTPAAVFAALPRAPPPPRGADTERCAICMAEMCAGEGGGGEALLGLPCGHSLHVGCATEWLARSTWCPLCKRGVATG